MQFKDIQSLENQAEELLQNMASIKQELSKKVTAREQFEQETAKITTSLTDVVNEVVNLKGMFENLGKSELLTLFTEINQANQQLTAIIPDFDLKVQNSLTSFDQLYGKLEQSNEQIATAFSKRNHEIATLMGTMEGYNVAVKNNFDQTSNLLLKSNEGVAMLTNRMESYDQVVAQYFEKIKTAVSKANADVTTLQQQLERSDQAAAKNFEQIRAQVEKSNEGIATLINEAERSNELAVQHVNEMKAEFSTEMHNLEQKVMNQQLDTTQKINDILKQMQESEARQLKLFEQVSSISKWLETNGEIVLANSRAGLFGRKQ